MKLLSCIGPPDTRSPPQLFCIGFPNAVWTRPSLLRLTTLSGPPLTTLSLLTLVLQCLHGQQQLSTLYYVSLPLPLPLPLPFNWSLSMPTCTCESYACNGKDVTPRAFENHLREDKRRKLRQAYARATQVCNKQNDDIAAYISSLTLSDSSTGGISVPGGCLWSSSVQDDDVNGDIAAYISSLKISDSHLVQDNVLSSLKLSNDAASGLHSMDTLLRSHSP